MLPLYVTSGEPAGIGPDICLSLADRVDERPIVVLADIHLLKQRAELLKKEIISQATSFHFRMIMSKPEQYKELYDFFAEYILKLIEHD